ncbi:hypothetical protein BASA81_001665 [Batrachochytrium salamandrivorans]|nr:hypothetical protein BASA81_001665 [Batrachochytrium salamandrivorans]
MSILSGCFSGLPTSSVPDDIFKEFTSVFSKKQSEKLPIHREFDCTIDLVPNRCSPSRKIYQLTREEDKVMQDWITENLAKGFHPKQFRLPMFLAHPCDSKPFILETDASDFAISGVLSQFDDLDQIRPVAFYARQMNSAERNYEIYDKELLAIVDSFKHWRHFLQGGLHPVTVLCDHKSLEYFMSTKEAHSSTGSMVFGTFRVRLLHYPSAWKT